MTDFLASLAAEPYEHRGIPHSEMALIIETCRRMGVQVVIESGRARGQSTYMLAKYLPEAHVHSVELRDHPDEDFAKARLANFANVELHCGDGKEFVPALAHMHWRGPVAILCDGPKGAAAVDIIARCFEYPHVVVAFVHDMRALDHGGPSPHRAYAVERFPNVRFSDDPRLIDRTKWLDVNVVAANGPVGPDHEKEFGSYGPTVGVFVNPNLLPH
jgi:hypothetical protein